MLLLKHYNHSNVTFPRSQWGLIRFRCCLCSHGLDFPDDCIGELGAFGPTPQVSCQESSLFYNLGQKREKNNITKVNK